MMRSKLRRELFGWDFVSLRLFEVVYCFPVAGGSIAETTWTFSRFGSIMSNVYNIGFFSDVYSLQFEDFEFFLLSLVCGEPLCSDLLDYILLWSGGSSIRLSLFIMAVRRGKYPWTC